MILDDVKALLDIKDDEQDPRLNIYIRKATISIQNYLNNPNFTIEYIQNNFQDAVIDIVTNAYNMKGKDNIKQEQQGSRNIVYKDNITAFIITKSVANLLPLPYVRMC